ncbi:CdaR family transcriptional regulator [Streptomyces sp. BK340]|uniref:PucR family transcriptional regulator n=1 Tax=Streptomyces sp. BK340 TaxID=2572903 RepID=UPI0011A5FC84|nr:helix-turn-helix domain-containing protein [Streptomyces sp. BK340]TVZ76757.1 DNA-binding PucR family transcriptional regulator [Streptomyces sp. BK340]
MRPGTGLSRVLDYLGTTLLDLIHGDPDIVDNIGGIAIHDPMDEPELPNHALVLGVGVEGPYEITRLLHTLGGHRAAGLVVRAPVPDDERIRAASRRSGTALLTLTRGASWSQLAALLRSVLAEGTVGGARPGTLTGMPSGDLFAIANAVAALLDAPITIEDRNHRVLAFSNRQDEADPSRVATILGRQAPEWITQRHEAHGVFRELYTTGDPVYSGPIDAANLPRVAIAVRAGDEVLGFIWAIAPGPLTAEREKALQEAAQVVALELLGIRAGADVSRRVRTDLVGTALEGGPGAAEALVRLGMVEQTTVVMACALKEQASDDQSESHVRVADERQRLANALSLHLSVVDSRSATALIGEVCYGIVPIVRSQTDAEDRAVRIAKNFLDRTGDRVTGVIGVGTPANDVAGLASSRLAAERALRVLRSRRSGRLRVARIADIHVDWLLLELGGIVAAEGKEPIGPLARLIAYDTAHNSRLVETLQAWLDTFGDVTKASARLAVHPNTLRYRLRRVVEIGGIDLDDAESRFAAMLQLRLMLPPITSDRLMAEGSK